ncbi:hypothetical protein [Mastigocladopsis repens]|nr:hypothetical protein [Mastigocladopsis repens]
MGKCQDGESSGNYGYVLSNQEDNVVAGTTVGDLRMVVNMPQVFQ